MECVSQTAFTLMRNIDPVIVANPDSQKVASRILI